MNAPSLPPSALRLPPPAQPPDLSTREAFDGFVAGTFYREMLKGLRSGAGENPYFGGGQADKVFKAQLDGELADVLASSRGDTFTEDLYAAFARQTGVR